MKQATPYELAIALQSEVRADVPDVMHMFKLIRAGAMLEHRDEKDNDTPLLAAVRLKKTKAALLLINEGASVNAIDNDRRAPLYHAVNTRNLDVMKPLLEMNAPTGFITDSLVGQDRWDDYIYSLGEEIKKRDAAITHFPVMKKISLLKPRSRRR